MSWTAAEPSANFTSNPRPYVPLNSNFRTNNVDTMLEASGKNRLKNFIQLQQVRRDYTETLLFGDMAFFNRTTSAPHLFAMARTHAKFGNLLLVVNLSNDVHQPIDLTAKPRGDSDPAESPAGSMQLMPPQMGRVVMMNQERLSSSFGSFREGDEVMLQNVKLAPSQAVLFSYGDFTRGELGTVHQLYTDFLTYFSLRRQEKK